MRLIDQQQLVNATPIEHSRHEYGEYKKTRGEMADSVESILSVKGAPTMVNKLIRPSQNEKEKRSVLHVDSLL